MDMENIGKEVDMWIAEEDIPVRANLKPISKYDIYSDMDEDEYEAYRDFMYWYLTKDHAVLMSLPATEKTFWAIELDEGDAISLFIENTFKIHGGLAFFVRVRICVFENA